MNDEVTLTKLGVDGADIVCDIARIGMGYIWQIGLHKAVFVTGGAYYIPTLICQLVTGTLSFGSGMVTSAVTFGTGMLTKITNMVSVVKKFQAFHESMPKETTIPHAPHNATISEQAKMEKAKEKFVVDAYQAAFALACMISSKLEEIWPGTFYYSLPIINFILAMVVMYYSNYFFSTRTREQGTKNIDPPTPAKNKPRTPPKNDKPRSARAKSPSKSQSQVQKRKTK